MLSVFKFWLGVLLCLGLCSVSTGVFSANVTVPAQFLSNDSFTGFKGYGRFLLLDSASL
jgi:hypothetical protein